MYAFSFDNSLIPYCYTIPKKVNQEHTRLAYMDAFLYVLLVSDQPFEYVQQTIINLLDPNYDALSIWFFNF